jgi:hypothetical protein
MKINRKLAGQLLHNMLIMYHIIILVISKALGG